MLDFHSHLIPGVDDGSKDLSMSMGMLDMWKEQGVSHICATPHFYADMNNPAHFIEKRNAAFSSLVDAINNTPDPGSYPSIALGAEVYYFRGMSSCEDISRLCLQGTRFILVEMPFHPWSDYMIKEVSELHSMGLIPVAAHLERYIKIQSREKMNSFLDTGIMIQCNASFFLHPRTRRKAMRKLADGTIDFIGSDAHNLDTRAPNIGPAVAAITKKLGDSALDHVRKNERLLTNPVPTAFAGGAA